MNNEYFSRSEVSNSDLTALKEIMHPRPSFGDKEAIFRFGSLVDALITEPQKVNHYSLIVDGTQYSPEEFQHATEMKKALFLEATKDPFLERVLQLSDTQRCMVNKAQQFNYCDFDFTLDTRCKWDWWIPLLKFGGDLKTTFATSQKQFDEAVDFFDWDRSRAWYMDIAQSNSDFIYGISKKNFKVFKKFIRRDDTIYKRGKEKYQELAFSYWCMTPKTN